MWDSDEKRQIGNLECSVCAAKYSMDTNALTEPIDIYCEWLDESEKANTGTA